MHIIRIYIYIHIMCILYICRYRYIMIYIYIYIYVYSEKHTCMAALGTRASMASFIAHTQNDDIQDVEVEEISTGWWLTYHLGKY